MEIIYLLYVLATRIPVAIFVWKVLTWGYERFDLPFSGFSARLFKFLVVLGVIL